MTAIRSWVRRGLSKDPRPKEIPEGRELDWLAKEICGNTKWDVKSLINYEELFRLQRDANTINMSIGAKVVEIRAHLGTITGWHTVSNAARGLKMALDGAMEHICGSDGFQINPIMLGRPNRALLDRGDSIERFDWGICIEIRGEPTMLQVSMERQVTEDGNVDGSKRYGPWNTNQEVLEAILSLWMGSLRERNDQLETNRETLNQKIAANLERPPVRNERSNERPPVSNLYWKDYVTVVGHADQQFRSIYESWISRGTKLAAFKTHASEDIAGLSILQPEFNLALDGRDEGEISARVLIGCPYHGDRAKGESASVISGFGGDDVCESIISSVKSSTDYSYNKVVFLTSDASSVMPHKPNKPH